MRILLALCLCALVACSPAPSKQDSQLDQPLASPNDKRTYRYLELTNQLKVLLVSDPGTDKAAAALDVAVGSGDDPLTRLGLAHYLEHMLFLGTEKYPNPDDYGDFISSHGGGHNAYTSFDHTNYFFDVAAEHFEPALDRFAQFFVAPKFDPRYVEREINAVHSEYSSKMLDDFRRGYDVSKQVMNPAHPMAKFSVGSLESLSADKDYEALRGDLIRFYDKHYSANNMRLVVFGAENLDQLQSWVESKFSAVENKNIRRQSIEAPLFDPSELPMQVDIKPYREMKTLSIEFALPDVSDDYDTKPLSYVGNILGHEGEGSLLSFLKGQGWVDGLGAGLGITYDGGSMFSISMDLTDAGEQHIDAIIANVFAAINMLKTEGMQASLYNEQAVVSKQRFDNREPGEPINEVSQLASDMHEFAPLDILQGHYLYRRFEPKRILSLLGYMTPDRMLVTRVSPNADTDKVSPYFNAPYRVSPISQQRVADIMLAAVNPQIIPPKANPFIAEHTLLAVSNTGHKVPQQLRSDRGVQLWYQQDNEFRVPKGDVTLRFGLPAPAMMETEQAVALSMFASVISDRLNELVYPAQLAGVSFSIAGSQRGLDIHLGGFSSGHEALMEAVLASVVSYEANSDRFIRIKNDMLEGYQRALLDKPYKQVMRNIQQLLLSPTADLEASMQILRDMTEQDMLATINALRQVWQAEIMVFGNYSEQHARRFAALVEPLVTNTAVINPPLTTLKRVECQTECTLGFAVEDNDTAVLNYLQAPGGSYQDRAATAVLANMLQAPFFLSLRTEQQLGYIVGAYPYAMHAYPGLALLVQSPAASDQQVQSAIDIFLQEFASQSEEKMCADYVLSQAAVISQLREEDKNLAERASSYWQDLQYGDLGFDGKAQIATAVENMSCQAWRSMVLPMVSKQYPGRLAIVAQGAKSSKISTKIENATWKIMPLGRNKR